MKREVLVNDTSAGIEAQGSRIVYRRAGSEPITADFEIQSLEPGSYWVRIDGNSYRVMLGTKGEVSVNGRTLRMEVFDPRDLRSTGRGSASHGRQEIIAPMPGKIVRVIVAAGDTVEEGQGVVVVEAMKMQNEMKSPKAGTVVEVRTRPDQTVGAGDVLLVIE